MSWELNPEQKGQGSKAKASKARSKAFLLPSASALHKTEVPMDGVEERKSLNFSFQFTVSSNQ